MDCSAIIPGIKPSIAFIMVMKEGKVTGQGSGFVFGAKNVLITCNHVIQDCDAAYLHFPDYEKDKWIPAKVAIQDNEHDLALLKFEDETRPPLLAASPEDITEGIEILLAGYPLSISSLTTHQGILSAIAKDATGVTTYLIDGTVNPGNSGCPAVDKKGRVVGVVNATRREEAILISKVQGMSGGTISINGIDLVAIHKALIKNLQLGIGYAVPCGYIPSHKSLEQLGGTQ